jgi:hypothetical protein
LESRNGEVEVTSQLEGGEDIPMNLHNSYSSDERLWYYEDDSYNATRERCKQCSFWIKYTLFTINFFVWVGGICLVIIGIWARLEKAKLGSFDNLGTDPALFLLIVGIVMFFISIFGCLGSLRENICLLKAFCVVIAVVFVIEVILGILAFFFIEYVRNNLLEYFHTATYTYQDDSDLKSAVDYIQKKFHCCGAETYNDWELNIYYNCSSPARSRCGVPISCCRVPTNNLCGFQTRVEGEVYAAHTIYTKGCIGSLMVIFKDNLIIIGLIAFGVGFVELFAILLAHSLIKEILLAKKEYNETTRLRMDLHKVYDSTTTP